MVKRLIILGFLFFNGCYLFGQFGAYKKGLVVLDNGDTLRGFIKDNVQEVDSKKVFFKDSVGSKKIFLANEVRYFKREEKSYVKVVIAAVNHEVLHRLLKVISDGKCKLLKDKYARPMNGGGSDSGYNPKIYYYIMASQDSLIIVSNRDYEQIINKYFGDSKVKGKEYRFGNIESDFIELNKLQSVQ